MNTSLDTLYVPVAQMGGDLPGRNSRTDMSRSRPNVLKYQRCADDCASIGADDEERSYRAARLARAGLPPFSARGGSRSRGESDYRRSCAERSPSRRKSPSPSRGRSHVRARSSDPAACHGTARMHQMRDAVVDGGPPRLGLRVAAPGHNATTPGIGTPVVPPPSWVQTSYKESSIPVFYGSPLLPSGMHVEPVAHVPAAYTNRNASPLPAMWNAGIATPPVAVPTCTAPNWCQRANNGIPTAPATLPGTCMVPSMPSNMAQATFVQQVPVFGTWSPMVQMSFPCVQRAAEGDGASRSEVPAAGRLDLANYVTDALRVHAARLLFRCLRVSARRHLGVALARWWRRARTSQGDGSTATAISRLAGYDRGHTQRDRVHLILTDAVADEARQKASHERSLTILMGLRQLISCLRMQDQSVMRSALHQLRLHAQSWKARTAALEHLVRNGEYCPSSSSRSPIGEAFETGRADRLAGVATAFSSPSRHVAREGRVYDCQDGCQSPALACSFPQARDPPAASLRPAPPDYSPAQQFPVTQGAPHTFRPSVSAPGPLVRAMSPRRSATAVDTDLRANAAGACVEPTSAMLALEASLTGSTLASGSAVHLSPCRSRGAERRSLDTLAATIPSAATVCRAPSMLMTVTPQNLDSRGDDVPTGIYTSAAAVEDYGPIARSVPAYLPPSTRNTAMMDIVSSREIPNYAIQRSPAAAASVSVEGRRQSDAQLPLALASTCDFPNVSYVDNAVTRESIGRIAPAEANRPPECCPGGLGATMYSVASAVHWRQAARKGDRHSSVDAERRPDTNHFPPGFAGADADPEDEYEEEQAESPSRPRAPSEHPRLSVSDVAKRRTLAARALGVNRDAGRRTVTQAFRTGALDSHPDKGGEKAKFQVLNEAYMKMKQPQTPTARRTDCTGFNGQ